MVSITLRLENINYILYTIILSNIHVNKEMI